MVSAQLQQEWRWGQTVAPTTLRSVRRPAARLLLVHYRTRGLGQGAASKGWPGKMLPVRRAADTLPTTAQARNLPPNGGPARAAAREACGCARARPAAENA